MAIARPMRLMLEFWTLFQKQEFLGSIPVFGSMHSLLMCNVIMQFAGRYMIELDILIYISSIFP